MCDTREHAAAASRRSFQRQIRKPFTFLRVWAPDATMRRASSNCPGVSGSAGKPRARGGGCGLLPPLGSDSRAALRVESVVLLDLTLQHRIDGIHIDPRCYLP